MLDGSIKCAEEKKAKKGKTQEEQINNQKTGINPSVAAPPFPSAWD
jgi:hypothetical protein